MAGQITHEWNGSTLIVTSDSGTSACDLQGPQGVMGIRGPQGAPGLVFIDNTLNIQGQAADAKAVGEALKKVVNPNLLINGDFRINQRGQSEYTTSGINKYCVDRWYLPANNNYSVIVTPTENGLTINKPQSTNYGAYNIAQFVEDYKKFKGKTLTATMYFKNCAGSFMIGISDGVTNSFSNATTTESGYLTVTHTVSNDATQLRVIVKDGTTSECSITLEACKLEIGDKATAFSPRLSAEELALCQRYYQRWDFAQDTSLPVGVGRNATVISLNIPISEMRPYHSFKTEGTVKLLNENKNGLTFTYNHLYRKMLRIFIISTDVEVGKGYLIAGETNGYFAIDAEIY